MLCKILTLCFLCRAFSIHSQACEAGLTDIQIQQLNQQYNNNKRRRTVSYPAVLTTNVNTTNTTNYMTFPDSKNTDEKKSNGTNNEIVSTWDLSFGSYKT